MLRYAVVTPARNESDNLPRLAAAMQAQSRLPVTWLIVDDGSDDGTRELAVALSEHEPWIEVVDARPDRGGPLEAGRREGRDLLAFRLGVDRLPAPVDVVVKVDADVAFDPDFFRELCARFEADPSLAIASGSCHELEDGEWVHRRIVQGAVWGATRAYRWDALDAVMTLEPRLGWDGLDEFRVQLRGYRTEAFTELVFQHHRREHSREPGRWRAHADQGRATWYMGYRPSYVALRSLYRARDDRAALAMAYGYAHAALRRDARFPERDVRQAIRRRQRFLVTLRRGAPSS